MGWTSRGFEYRRGEGFFCPAKSPDLLWDLPASYTVSTVGKAAGERDDIYHLPTFSVEVRKEWRYTPAPSYTFIP
jgi:hypothetical protein